MARTKTPERLSFAQNPPAGTLLAAPAGGQAEAEFDFYNDSPDVASFYLEVEGLPEDWFTGVGTAYESYAAAAGGGQLRLSLNPPLMSAVGEYDFKVRLMSLGAPVDDGTPLVLRVDPPLEQPVSPPTLAEPAAYEAPTLSVPPVNEPPDAQETTTRTRAPRKAATSPAPEPEVVTPPEPEPAAVVPPPPIAEPVRQSAPPVVEPERVVLAPEPEPTPTVHLAPPPKSAPIKPSTPAAEPAPTTRPAQTPAQQAPATAQPTPRTTPVQPTPPTTQPTRPVSTQPSSEPAREEPVLVDYDTRGAGTAGQAIDYDEDEAPVVEPFLLDPKDGMMISLRPGETVLLRFPFTNDTPRERTYILDEDRGLEDGWLTLVQDQVNLGRNGQGELSVRLSPPLNADPGDYPFTVTTGPQGGQVLPRVLTLSVLANPAVQLTTKDKTVKVGPFSSDVVFPLSVESIGNADTAFRVAVKAPLSEATDSKPVGPGDVYETPQWRYLFDKEMETLRSPMSGQQPRPVPIHLRVRRKGVWWFGFKEQHQLRVAAVPVTEPGNGGKAGNSLELTAVRSRILPFPLLMLIPIILLIMLFLSGGARDLSVTNAQYAQGNAYWIVEPKDSDTKKLALTWAAPPLALLRLTGTSEQEGYAPFGQTQFGGGTYQGAVKVSSQQREVIYHYRVSRLLGGGDQDVLAHFIYTRKDTPLAVTDATTHRVLYGSDVTLTVPPSGYARLDIKNTVKSDLRVDWWMVKGLDESSANAFLYNKGHGSLEPEQSEHFLIKRNPDSNNAGTEEQIVLVTTDANRPVITIHLKPGQ